MTPPLPPIRICEWGRLRTEGLTADERLAIERAARGWQERNRFPQPPLAFGGADGRTLLARQYIGVVEAAGRTVEIYPKLDAHLLEAETISEEGAPLESVMQSVLWMTDVAEIGDAPDAGAAALDELPTDFIDLFAFLLARNLRAELHRGMSRQYERQEDDLVAVRGRIDVAAQIRRNTDRMDKLACVWDEFTPDTAVNRLLRCACRHLLHRCRHESTTWLLRDCLLLLDDVADVSAIVALNDVRHLRHWSRGMERFRRSFDLACRLLRGFGHALEAAEADTFVFLVDMNKLFEDFVAVVLAARFETRIDTQHKLGTLLQIYPGGIQQLADFYFRDRVGAVWIGDAKYKHLARGHAGYATFTKVLSEETSDLAEQPATAAERTRNLSPDDIRQLTVYAELEARRSAPAASPPNLMLLYPYVGSAPCQADQAVAWNGSRLYLVPVRLIPTSNLASAIPSLP